MEIRITFSDGLAGFEISEDGKKLNFGDLSREEQIKICNAFASGYNLYSRFIKEE